MSAKNKPEVVVVTGSSAGVGRAIAHAFAKRGAHVGLVARGQEGLDDAAREVESFGGQALGVPTDVADHHQVEAAAQKVEEHFGDIDVWVNDAMATVLARFLDTKPEEFKRATEVTYLGAVYGTMAALRRMTARDRGKIVQVGSALAYRAIPLQAAYCGAKFGIRGFTDSIRTELLHDKSKVQITMVQLNWGSTPPSSTGVDQSCPTTRCRSPRYTSPRSRPRRSTGLPTITAASCGWATAPCWRSWATRSPPASPTGTWARAGSAASRSAILPVSAERPDNLFEPVPNAATHGMFDDQAKVRSPQLWATTHRAVVGGGDPRQRAAGQPARQDSLDEPRLAGRDRAGCRDAPRPARVCATGRR
jgi:NAD(P)-dependent dehydrogenase (short-subunit alcohol dehydrogenase family)